MKISVLSMALFLAATSSFAQVRVLPLDDAPAATHYDYQPPTTIITPVPKSESVDEQRQQKFLKELTFMNSKISKRQNGYMDSLSKDESNIEARVTKSPKEVSCGTDDEKQLTGYLFDITKNLNLMYAEASLTDYPKIDPHSMYYTLDEGSRPKFRAIMLRAASEAAILGLPEYLDGADLLAASKCYDSARSAYHSVINKYTGSTYAAYRQRADIGLRELDDAQKHY